ncbi:MAG: restriction endonuclease [Burkholderiales bacterium RIFCSPHIGHO2_12_FULL_61_11]|nr:MAG: restriction endonuclease [Burkholderiales bacterium RIFCSPHIGHO2_12_FULL_61_11]
MTIPTYDKFIEPILRFLATKPDGVSAREAHDAAARALGISEVDRQELLPSGAQPIYKNRAGWAHDRLKRAGLSSSPRRGFWQLTTQGLAFVASHLSPLTVQEVEQLAIGFMDVRLKSAPNGESLPSQSLTQAPTHESALASPDDRLGEAIVELRKSAAAELLEALAAVSPSFFETIVLDVLHRMGYGASRADLQRVGGSGDGGIDGVISLDRLGLEKVYVQAKRWQATVGRPEVQGFYGALAGQRANKGVFITTSGYTSQAIEFARSVERIVLVDGPRLAELMIDHEVGVSARTVKIPKIDSDYFDEDSA